MYRRCFYWVPWCCAWRFDFSTPSLWLLHISDDTRYMIGGGERALSGELLVRLLSNACAQCQVKKKKRAIVWAWPSIQLAFAETLYKNCEHSEHMNKFFVVAVLRTIISQKLFSRRLLHTRSTCQKREKSETCPSVVQYLFLIASNISQAHSLLPRSGWSL